VLEFLKRGGGLHHLCFEVDDLDSQIRQMRASRSVLARAPLPAVAFDGRRIGWMLTPDRLLVEYLERERLDGSRPRDPLNDQVVAEPKET
jgi:methylmalonyl-CoA/ethylmalonyl-CoA epimerase